MTIGISWNQLVYGEFINTLANVDVISVQVTEGTVASHLIRIELSLGSEVSWWKALKASDQLVCECQGVVDSSSKTIDYALFSANEFTFWKAMFLGVHTPMYTLENQNTHMTGGNTYSFEWHQDGATIE